MNRYQTTSLLTAAALIAALATAGVCYWYLQVSRQYQQTQMNVASINRNRALLQALAAESVEYSKRNPAILPILQSVGVRMRTEEGATNTAPGN